MESLAASLHCLLLSLLLLSSPLCCPQTAEAARGPKGPQVTGAGPATAPSTAPTAPATVPSTAPATAPASAPATTKTIKAHGKGPAPGLTAGALAPKGQGTKAPSPERAIEPPSAAHAPQPAAASGPVPPPLGANDTASSLSYGTPINGTASSTGASNASQSGESYGPPIFGTAGSSGDANATQETYTGSGGAQAPAYGAPADGGGGGLSGGAIAGIVIGVLLGVLVLVGVSWLCVARSQNAQRGKYAYGDTRGM